VVKEMRLKGVSTTGETNRFLSSYLPVYNKRFSVAPKKEEDLHRTPDVDLDTALCIKAERMLKNDNTIQYKGTLYQIDDKTRTKRVIVEEHLDGNMNIRSKGLRSRSTGSSQGPSNPRKNDRSCPRAKVTAPRSIVPGDHRGSGDRRRRRTPRDLRTGRGTDDDVHTGHFYFAKN
jgi:hypothetical protein